MYVHNNPRSFRDPTRGLSMVLRLSWGGAAPSKRGTAVQGYLALEKKPPRRTLQEDYAWGRMVALGGAPVSYERCTAVQGLLMNTDMHRR